MPLLLETIKIEEGKVHHLDYHQKRFDKSREALFNIKKSLVLSSYIETPKNGLYRCRIIYDSDIRSVEYIPYSEKKIEKLKVVSADIDYGYKYENRSVFNHLLEIYSDFDEVIIEKDGLVTDTTISNLAFYDGTQWFTPSKPLLKGTTRERLLNNGFLQTREIKSFEITKYKKVALMNAMIGFKIINPEIIM